VDGDENMWIVRSLANIMSHIGRCIKELLFLWTVSTLGLSVRHRSLPFPKRPECICHCYTDWDCPRRLVYT